MEEPVIFCVAIQVLYAAILFRYNRLWKKLLRKSPRQATSELNVGNLPFVTVVIPVRNEAKNVGNLLRSLSHQTYRNFEIIVVNDHSEDQTVQVVQASGVKVMMLNLESETGKKAALTTGINAANGKWIVTLDGDVTVPDGLVEELIGIGETEDAVMVCGMVILKAEDAKPSWWSKFQTMEFAVLQLCGMAAISQHKMLVNSGANLAFRKGAWVKLGGYESYAFIPSGDDTFLMMEMEKRYPGRVVAAPDAVVTTGTMPTFGRLVDQRSRWASKTRYYKSTYVNFIGVAIVLSAFAFVFNLITLIGCVGGTSSVSYPILTGMLLAITAELILLKSWSDKYRQPFAFWDGFRMSLLHPFFICFLLLVTPFNKSEWKGRKL